VSHTHTHTHTHQSTWFSVQHTTTQGQSPCARHVVQRRRARAGARRPASVLGCTRPGRHGVRVHQQEEGWLGTKTGCKHARLGAQCTTPRSGITGEVHQRASAVGYRSEVVLGAGVHTGTTFPSPSLAAQDQYGIKAGSQESAARRTTLDIAARRQGWKPLTSNSGGLPARA
jgi:hypothetical protein